MSVADTSRTHTDMDEAGSARGSTGPSSRSGSLRESRACVFHICGGIAMLLVGVGLLIIT